MLGGLVVTRLLSIDWFDRYANSFSNMISLVRSLKSFFWKVYIYNNPIIEPIEVITRHINTSVGSDTLLSVFILILSLVTTGSTLLLIELMLMSGDIVISLVILLIVSMVISLVVSSKPSSIGDALSVISLVSSVSIVSTTMILSTVILSTALIISISTISTDSMMISDSIAAGITLSNTSSYTSTFVLTTVSTSCVSILI
mmetsp:Transcript_19667/g.17856  ORF Transcript_19667/g.17856 Transcript_19667/m.17856 type:complete len:201 (-) Transcript_19667:1489-2091(-)